MSYRDYEKALGYSRQYRKKLQVEMLQALGNECACCKSIFHLTLDHIIPIGAKRGLKPIRCGGPGDWLKARSEGWPRDKYQILCGSCNQNKGNGMCEHESARILYGGVGLP